ncbi:dehydrogenase [Dehalobacter sp. 12DCB1]|nr:dehydrogenase [Dehalobacter sp. 14DCB1]TCX54995.1 dehydrogenase [Dehalobacter sp. 12DCB1]
MRWMKENKGAKEAEIIVAVPNVWLRLPIVDLLFLMRKGYIHVKSLMELYERVEKKSGGILIIDIFAYKESCPDTIARLKTENPTLTIVPLLSRDELVYAHYLESIDACFIVEKEKADKMLLPALHQALQKQQMLLNEKEVNLMGKEDGNILRRNFGRRTFLKGTAAAAAMAGAVAASPGSTVLQALAAGDDAQTTSPEEQIFAGACPSCCEGGCSLNVHVRNGKIVKTSKRDFPDKKWNRICGKGLSHALRTYEERRLKYPMRRVGERGEGKWEQLSWDEAIQYICEKWKGYLSEYGGSSISYSFAGGNSTVCVNNYLKRLFNWMGGTFVFHMLDMAAVDAPGRAVGYGPWFFGNSLTDIMNSKYIFIWGTNPTSSYKQNWHFVQEAAENGAKVIVIDPNYTITASKADKFVPIRMSTDAALAMAMINIVVKEGLADKEFIAQNTVGPFLVKESDGLYLRQSDLGGAANAENNAIVVRGADGKVGLPSEIPNPVINGTFEINGIKVTTAYDLLLERTAEWTPEKASELCDIPVETIYELARMYAAGPTCLYASEGIDHMGNAAPAYAAMYALAMVTGQLAKHGAGVSGVQGLCLGSMFDCSSIIYPPGKVPGPTIPSLKLLDILNEGMYAGKPMAIKSLFVSTANILRAQAERKSWIEVFNKLDLVVVADQYMSDTAKHADIVLPVCGYFEYESVLTMFNPFAKMTEKAIDPLYESKPDLEIINLLGKGMGFGDEFVVTRDEFYTKLMDSDACKAVGISWEKLKQEKTMRYMSDDYVHGAAGVTSSGGAAFMTGAEVHAGSGTFPTPTGRAQFYQEAFKPYIDYGQKIDQKKESLPYWEPPIEAWPDKPLFSKYPLIFATERSRLKANTGYTHVQWLLEIMPEPFIKINPQDAAVRGIVQGDTVKIVNDRGYMVLKAFVTPAVRPGVVVANHGFEHDQFIDGDEADLTSRAINPAVPNNAYFDTLCEVKKM